VAEPLRLKVASMADAEHARRAARGLARTLGFDRTGVERVALATSELATNLVRYAPGGEIVLSAVDGPAGSGLQLESLDKGPGIADVGRALVDGFSTSGGLGSGLPSARRMMDQFEIESGPQGTRIVARSWPTPP
jgi:serine/threonine-protein kinase RsbT